MNTFRVHFLFVLFLSNFSLIQKSIACEEAMRALLSFEARPIAQVVAKNLRALSNGHVDFSPEIVSRLDQIATHLSIPPRKLRQLFSEQVLTSLEKRSDELFYLDLARIKSQKSDLLFANEYMFYTDQLRVSGNSQTLGFDHLNRPDFFNHLSELGIETLYPLPFLRNTGDGGFAVSNYFEVASELGGNKSFLHFLAEAKRRQFNVKMDMVLNHVSNSHRFFEDFQRLPYSQVRDRFITKKNFIPGVGEMSPDDMPLDSFKVVSKQISEEGPTVTYLEKDRDGLVSRVTRRLIFPDEAQMHYRQVAVIDEHGNSDTLWVYHTFKSIQPDLNYENPEVIGEFFQVLSFWANKGVDVFRFDAIPFLDKMAENSAKTHAIVELFSLYLNHIAPGSMIMVEANQMPRAIMRYLGDPLEFFHPIYQQQIRATTQAQMAYDFKNLPALWSSLLTKDKRFFKEAITSESLYQGPEGTSWALISRVHDELTLEMASSEQRQLIREALEGRGLTMREGYGFAGRMGDFLGSESERVRLGHFLNLSRRGGPVIYYGDEIAARNNLEFLIKASLEQSKDLLNSGQTLKLPSGKLKEELQELMSLPLFRELQEIYAQEAMAITGRELDLTLLQVDPRFINRGLIEIGDQGDNQVFKSLRELLNIRKNNQALRKGVATWIDNPSPHLITYTLNHENRRVLVVANLGHKKGNLRSLYDMLNGRPPRDLISGETVSFEEVPPYAGWWIEI